jgi:RimJ/RimL family protein N-acetyltransferase
MTSKPLLKQRIVAITDARNDANCCLLERVGMIKSGHATHHFAESLASNGLTLWPDMTAKPAYRNTHTCFA